MGTGTPIQNRQIILHTNPIDGARELDVSIKPIVTFDVPIETDFVLEDANGIPFNYHIELDVAKISYYGLKVNADMEWNDNKTQLIVKPFNFLPANDTLKLIIKVKVFENGVEITAEGEELTVQFTTADSPNYVPKHNVKASYPLDGQYNFYRDEWYESKGYILLHAGQPDLFEELAEQVQDVIRFTSGTGAILEKSIEYNGADRMIDFAMPGDITNGTVYKMELVRKDGSFSGAGQANANMSVLNEEILYTAHFRASQFNTFFDKMEYISGLPQSTNQHFVMSIGLSSTEPFDKYELVGSTEFDPLIKYDSDLLNTRWYNYEVKDLMYKYFPDPSLGIELDWRDASLFGGVPPNKAAFVSHPLGVKYPFVSEANFSGTAPVGGIGQSVHNSTIRIIFNDFVDLKKEVDDYVAENSDGTHIFGPLYIREFFELDDYDGFPEPQVGDTFPVIIKYTLPGMDISTSIYSLSTFYKSSPSQ